MSHPIHFFDEYPSIKLQSRYELWIKWLMQVLDTERAKVDFINVIFCNDDYLLDINREYLNHDYYTDVITFQYQNEPIQADIFISIDRVKSNAEIFAENDFFHELQRVLVHGILHLCGWSDRTDQEKQIIRTQENKYLDLLAESN